MLKKTAERQPNAGEGPPAKHEDATQAVERRRVLDALEDDEVYEALMALHSPNPPHR